MIVMGSWHSGCQRREANAGDIFKASEKKKRFSGCAIKTPTSMRSKWRCNMMLCNDI